MAFPLYLTLANLIGKVGMTWELDVMSGVNGLERLLHKSARAVAQTPWIVGPVAIGTIYLNI